MIPGDKAYYPGTDVLINKFDIRDPVAARAAEYKLASVRELELSAKPIEGNFDFKHLQAIHKHVFQDYYDWAGKIREVDFAKRNKDTGMVNKFVPKDVMFLKVEEFEKFLKDKNELKGLTKPEFVKAIAEVHTRLNEIHPFREGNGRSTRVYLTQLAREAGYEFDMSKVDKDRWNLASHKAQVQHDPKSSENKLPANQMEIRQIFHETMTPTMKHAFTVESREAAVRHYPQLKTAYDRLDAIAQVANKSSTPEVAQRIVEAEKQRIVQKLESGTVPQANPYFQGRIGHGASYEASKAHTAAVKQGYTPPGNSLARTGEYASTAAAGVERKAKSLRM